ncbi:MAG: iron-containing alcohol dehydrogenase [Coriobacteriales bacterium]|jgi:alcohol dehydrogenase class IV|nr:iron-containing alcohol dehydrogenase [Coriobacteriales bacterium]
MAMGSKYSEYALVCPVLYGAGAVEELPNKVKMFGASKAFLVYDAGVKASGMAERITGLLEQAGISVAAFDDVKADPTDAAVEAIGEAAQAAGSEVVIGLGGGSVLDSAKMVALLLKTPGRVADHFLTTPGALEAGPAPSAPLILIPTTSGSGSEVSIVAVISHAVTHAKDAVFTAANSVILDPELTVTAPPHVTAFAGLDVLAHALEAYTSASADPLSSLVAYEAIRLVAANLKRVYDDGSDIEARSNMAIASNFAGMAFNNTGLHFGHTFGHELGGAFNLPHGMASAYAIPTVIRFTGKHDPERAAKIAEAFGVASAEEAAQKATELMRYVGIKKFSENGITVEAAQALAEDAIAHNVFFHNTVVPLAVDDFKALIAEIVTTYDED